MIEAGDILGLSTVVEILPPKDPFGRRVRLRCKCGSARVLYLAALKRAIKTGRYSGRCKACASLPGGHRIDRIRGINYAKMFAEFQTLYMGYHESRLCEQTRRDLVAKCGRPVLREHEVNSIIRGLR